MRPKVSQNEEHQLQSGRTLLSSFIDMKNELVRLGDVRTGNILIKNLVRVSMKARVVPIFPPV